LGGSGLNIYETSSLFVSDVPIFQNYQDDLTFHAELLLDLVRRKQVFTFRPISWHETDQISNVRLFNQTKKLFLLLRAHSFSI
jgi:hypothetical protein